MDFFFRLFPSGLATADFPSPVVPIFCILFHHFKLSHVLFHHIHKPPFLPSPVSSFLATTSSASFSQYRLPIIFPPYMSIPPQSCLTCFLSKPSHMCCPSDGVDMYSNTTTASPGNCCQAICFQICCELVVSCRHPMRPAKLGYYYTSPYLSNQHGWNTVSIFVISSSSHYWKILCFRH